MEVHFALKLKIDFHELPRYPVIKKESIDTTKENKS